MPSDTVWGRALTVLIGAAVTVVIQSSSAGVATVLVLLSAGAVSFPQAAALVIGMDVGTTVTALLAGLGGGRAMRRTGVAHLVYNVVTGTLAFLVLPLALPLILWANGGDAISGLVMFHSGFNLAGVVLFLPFVGRFSAMVERLVPGLADPLADPLDSRLLADEGAALDAAQGAAQRLSGVLLQGAAARLSGKPGHPEDASRIDRALDDLEAFLTRINLPEGAGAARLRYSALLHQFDHLHRLSHRVFGPPRPGLAMHDAALKRPASVLAAACLRAAKGERDSVRMARLRRLIAGRNQRFRRAMLLREHLGTVPAGAIFDVTDALRWIERTADHAARILHYNEAAAAERPTEPGSARPRIAD